MSVLPVVLTIVTIGVYTLTVIRFGSAIRHHFIRPLGVPPMMRVLGGLGLVGTFINVILMLQSRMPLIGVIIGLACLFMANGVFSSAIRETTARPISLAFSSDAPQMLITSGIYGHIRHPFYTSYILFWLGAAFATVQWIGVVIAAVMSGLYFWAATIEERKFAESELSTAYFKYRASTGMFIPTFGLLFSVKS